MTNRTRIKLCGLTRQEDIRTVNSLRPDYVGFVFYAKSRRCVTEAQATRLKERLDPSVKAVGVFVNEDPALIARLLDRGIIDLAQLHGQEDTDYYNRLRSLTGKPLVKAFRVESPADCLPAEVYPSDGILLDSGMGSGVAFDWSAVAGVKRPYFLAGGLHAGNVAAAIRTLHPFAVDVSSGIETDGSKDKEKMKAFVEAVQSADSGTIPS